MGRTGTYNVVGIGESDGIISLYGCNTKTEMAQALRKSQKSVYKITSWEAQTATGRKMLNNPLTLPALVDCPICDAHGCCVCNYSGITSQNHWEKWKPWQLESIRAGIFFSDQEA